MKKTTISILATKHYFGTKEYMNNNKIYHLNIVAKDNELKYFWSDETCDK